MGEDGTGAGLGEMSWARKVAFGDGEEIFIFRRLKKDI